MNAAAGLDVAAHPEQVTAVIQHEVRPDAVDRYEQWLARIMPVAAGFKGHAGVDVVRPPPMGPRRYSVALRFASLADAQQWFGSDRRRALMAEAADLLVQAETVSTLTGLTLWFGATPGQRPPRRWKQFVVTLAAIYPLTLVVPWAVNAMLAAFGLPMPVPLRQLMVAVGIVALMTWVVMPRATRVLVRWLHR